MQGKITIDKDRCKGCEYCVEYCPMKCIELSKDINIRGVRYAVFVHMEKCTGCTICTRVCPDVCIEVMERRGGPLYHKMEKTLSRLIDGGLDKLRSMKPPDDKKRKTEEK